MTRVVFQLILCFSKRLYVVLRGLVFNLFVFYLHVGRPKHTKLLAVFKPDGIGDFVLSSSALTCVVKLKGSSNVSLIVDEHLVDLAATLFPHVEILPIVPGHARLKSRLLGLLRLRSVIQANAYEEVVCLRHYRTSYEDAILSALHTRKVSLLCNQFASTHSADIQMVSTPKHFKMVHAPPCASLGENHEIPREWSFHAAVLSEALRRRIFADTLRPEWDHWRKSDKAKSRFLLAAPLAGRPIRDIPPGLLTAAVRRAALSGLNDVLLTGSAAQSAQLNRYKEAVRCALPNARVAVISPPDLPAFVDVVAEATMIVTAESSAAHIAAALDKPALILVGGGHYGWFAPWRRSDKQVWLTNKLPCFDCNWRCPYPKPVCITDLTAAQVEDAMPFAKY